MKCCNGNCHQGRACPLVCTRCGGTGHLAAACPWAQPVARKRGFVETLLGRVRK